MGNRNFAYMRGASICANAIKLQHSLELLETQTLNGFFEYLKNLAKQAAQAKSKGIQQLVKKPEFNFVFSLEFSFDFIVSVCFILVKLSPMQHIYFTSFTFLYFVFILF